MVIKISCKSFKNFIDEWSIFLSAIILFDAVRGFIFFCLSKYNVNPYYKLVVDFDEKIFNGKLASCWLQEWVGAGTELNYLDIISAIIYSSHFFSYLALGIYFFNWRNILFSEYKRSFILLLILAVLFYSFIPTAPPWMLSKYDTHCNLRTNLFYIYQMYIPNIYRMMASNPIAAMPALHVAFPALCFFLIVHHCKIRTSILFLFYLLLMIFTVIYTASHYTLDVIVAILISYCCFFVSHYRENYFNNKFFIFMQKNHLATSLILFLLTISIKVMQLS